MACKACRQKRPWISLFRGVAENDRDFRKWRFENGVEVENQVTFDQVGKIWIHADLDDRSAERLDISSANTEEFINITWENDGNGVCFSFEDSTILADEQYTAMFLKANFPMPDYLNSDGSVRWYKESSLPVIRTSGFPLNLDCPDCDLSGLPIV